MKKVLTLVSMFFLLSTYTYAQEKTTMNVDDLNSDISKYVKKNFEGYKITEAFKYDLVYSMIVKKADSSVALVFNRKGSFLYRATQADKAKVSHQTRSTISLDDVESDITKYIKKNYGAYKLTEAYKYDEVYTTKVMKGAETAILVFDKEGAFVKKEAVAKPAPPAAHKTDSVHTAPAAPKTDSIPAKQEMKAEPAKTDSIKP